MCSKTEAKYALSEPKLDVKDRYVKEIQSHLLADAEARSLNSQGACSLSASSCKISAKHGTH